MSRHPARALLALFLTACASAPVERAYVAPSSQSIFSETTQGTSENPAHMIYVVNTSTVPVTVFGFALSGCENIKQQCTPRNVSIRVGAGLRSLITRVEPGMDTRAWNYRFSFSWRPDSAASRAIASALGVTRELTPADFTAMKDRIVAMRAEPESIMIAPGQQAAYDQVRILLVDKDNKTLGYTRWVRMRTTPSRAAQMVPPGRIVGRELGRGALLYALADEPQGLVGKAIPDIEVPIVVGFPHDPHAPVFNGTAMDADAKRPLSCTRVALEDSAYNVLSRARTDGAGKFELRSPRPGTYRVRFDLDGWSPFYGPNEVAIADEKKQTEYHVRFTEQMMAFRPAFPTGSDAEGARITGAAAPAPARGAPPGQVMRLGGSATLPIVDIVSRAAVGTMWLQFAVDDAGKVDSSTVVVPAGTVPAARAAILRTLPQLRYAPAKDNGKAVCDLVRLQVNFTAR